MDTEIKPAIKETKRRDKPNLNKLERILRFAKFRTSRLRSDELLIADQVELISKGKG